MKKIILMVIAMVMTVGIAEVSAAKKEVKMATTEFITTIDCDHCVKKVMDFMPHQKGVKDVKVNLPKKLVTVSYDAGKTSDAAIIKAFRKIDITAKKHIEPKAPTATPSRR